jgi:hypothetical protein
MCEHIVSILFLALWPPLAEQRWLLIWLDMFYVWADPANLVLVFRNTTTCRTKVMIDMVRYVLCVSRSWQSCFCLNEYHHTCRTKVMIDTVGYVLCVSISCQSCSCRYLYTHLKNKVIIDMVRYVLCVRRSCQSRSCLYEYHHTCRTKLLLIWLDMFYVWADHAFHVLVFMNTTTLAEQSDDWYG